MTHRTKGIWKWIAVAIVVALGAFGVSSLVGCSPEQMADWKAQSASLTEEVNSMKADYDQLLADYEAMVAAGGGESEAAAVMLRQLGRMSEEIDAGVQTVNTLNDHIQNAESGWDIAEGLVGAASVFFPGIGVAVPMIRTARRRFEGTVAAMAKAGGPKDPDLASRAMDPKLKAAVDAARRRIGDTVDRSEAA